MSLWLDRGAFGPSLVVEEDRIAGPGARYEDVVRLDCAWSPEVTIGPGAINAHTHLYSGLAPLGMPKPDPAPQSFVEILSRVWWRLDRALDEASLRASARLYLAEALLAGTTTLVDHHESPDFLEGSLDVLADAADELGVRLVVGYGATERNFGRDEAVRGLGESERFCRRRARGRVRGVVAIHASFTVSDDTIREAGELARALGVVVHVHLAEDVADVDDARRRGYAGPLARFLALDGLPEGSILAHGVHLSEDEVGECARRGLWLVQNPRSNEGNGVGYPNALGASAKVALGTDGYPATMADEAAALHRLSASHGEDPGAVYPRLRGGFVLASELTGCRLGTLDAGATADLVVAAPGAAPRHVIVGGDVVVRDGLLVRADIDEIRARARHEAPGLWLRMQR